MKIVGRSAARRMSASCSDDRRTVTATSLDLGQSNLTTTRVSRPGTRRADARLVSSLESPGAGQRLGIDIARRIGRMKPGRGLPQSLVTIALLIASIVFPSLQDNDVVVGDVVDEAVGFVDTA